jgi:hypothetical protein
MLAALQQQQQQQQQQLLSNLMLNKRHALMRVMTYRPDARCKQKRCCKCTSNKPPLTAE